MIFTFFKAEGKSVGSSLVEDDKLDLARELTAKAKVSPDLLTHRLNIRRQPYIYPEY